MIIVAQYFNEICLFCEGFIHYIKDAGLQWSCDGLTHHLIKNKCYTKKVVLMHG